jgi:peptidoglycan hydrolase-like protein with peptidoglycan-binding domain
MQTLNLGSTAPDVILFQTTLNNRPPTALPLLLVDGFFGTVTLKRVKEFQANNGLNVSSYQQFCWGQVDRHEGWRISPTFMV